MTSRRGRPWLRSLWLIPFGWALTLVGIYIDAYSTGYSRLAGLELAGPVFTGLAIYESIKRFSQERKRRRNTSAEDNGAKAG